MKFHGDECEDQRWLPSLPPWVYRWDPPFCLFAEHNGRPLEVRYFKKFDEAVQCFIRFHLGPIEGREATIIDDNMQIVLAYAAPSGTNQIFWLGTAQGFERFAYHHDPASVAIWETVALAGQEPPDTIPEDVVR